MKYLFFLGHPAHFHLFKNIIINLSKNGHEIKVLIKSKDILERLCQDSGLAHVNILPEIRKRNIISFIASVFKRYWRTAKAIKSFRPSVLLGSEPTLAHLGILFKIPSFVFSEDDVEIIPQFAKIAYPFVDVILSPESCNAGKWSYKKIGYNGYHKFAYLHPSVFTPDRSLINKIGDSDFIILRFAELSAYHDKNKVGIDKEIARKLIDILEPHGTIFITSERVLEEEFEKYRLSLNPQLIHHALYFAKMYIGDSQSMAVEAALLGTPGIRFNDFAGKIGVLNELENEYTLTYGIKTTDPDRLFAIIEKLLTNTNLENEFKERRQRMIKEKINVPSFFHWFIENYPESNQIMKENPDYQYNFRI